MGTTLTGKRVQNTYDSLLKLSDNDNLTSTAKIIGDGLGNDSPIYLSTTQIGIGVTPSFQFHVDSHAKIGGNLIVGGNLTVNGTTTHVDSTIVEIGDNMIELAAENVSNTKDIGWYGTINSSGEKYVGVFYDASSGVTVPTFRIGLGTVEPDSTAAWTVKGKVVIGALDATSGVFSSNVDIDGYLQVDGAIKDSDGDAGTSGQVLSSTGTGTNWVDFEADTAKRLEVDVKNVFGATMTKGTVVHAQPTGTLSGNVIEVVKADANVAANMPAIGILNEDLNDDEEGKAVMFGTVQGIDTSSFSVGDELYVSTTAGEFTATKPTATTELVQKIAVVVKSHASNGLIKVFGAGRSNDVPNEVDRDLSIAGNLKVDDYIMVESASGYGRLEVGGPSGGYIDLKTPFSDDYDLRIITDTTESQFTGSGDFKLNAGNTLTLTLGGSDQSATFAGDVIGGNATFTGADTLTIADYILHYDDGNTKFGFPSNDNFKIRLNGSDIFTLNTTSATFSNDLQIGTFGNNNAEFALGQTIADKVFSYGAEFQVNGADIQIVLGRNNGTSVLGTGGIGASGTNAFHVYDTTSISQLFQVAQTSGNTTIAGNLTLAGSIDQNGTSNNTFTGNIAIDNAAPILQVNSSNAASGFRINITGLDGDSDDLLRIQDANTTRFNIKKDGDISNSLIPHLDSTYGLGSSSQRWSVLYADTVYTDGANIDGVYKKVFDEGWGSSPSGGKYIEITLPFISGSGASSYYYFDILGYKGIGTMDSQLHYRVYLHSRAVGTNNNELSADVFSINEAATKSFDFAYFNGGSSSNKFLIKALETYSRVAIIAYASQSVLTSSMISSTTTAPSGYTDITFATTRMRGDLEVDGGDITLGGTGRVQGVDTVSANTDAANKLYVDNAVSGKVDGSGTANYVPRWLDSDTLGDSILNQSNNDIIIGYNSNSTHSFEKKFATGHATGNRGAEIHFGMDDGGGNVGMRVINSASSNSSYNAQHIQFHTHEGAVSVGKRFEITSTGESIFYGDVSTDTVQISNGTSYNENIRMFPSASNDYSSIVIGAVSGTSGTGDGQWTLVRYPDTTHDNKFAIRHNTTDILTITKDQNVSSSNLMTATNGFVSSVNSTDGGFTDSRDYAKIGTGSRAGSLIINDISGARYAMTGGGYDLSFYKETDNGSGSLAQDLYMRVNSNSAAASVLTVEVFKPLTIRDDVVIEDNLDVIGDGHLFLGSDDATPKIDMLYDLHASGRGWDTRIFIGKSDDLPNGAGNFPTSEAAGGFGIQFQGNSDGAFFGIEKYSDTNYRPVINWGDDSTDSPFRFKFNNGEILNITKDGKITGDGVHLMDRFKPFSDSGSEWIGSSSSTLELSGTNINLNGASGSNTPNLKHGGTTILDVNKNMSSIGTIDSGAITVTADAGNEQIKIRRASNNNEQLIFGFHSSDYARIFAVEQGVAYRDIAINQDGGNVAIGRINPDSKLHVNGVVKFEGTGVANTPTLRINNSSSSSFNHTIEAIAANMTSGETNIIVVGKEGNTRNSGYIGYYWSGHQSVDNYVTFGHWGVDHVMKIYGSGDIHLNSYAYAVANVNSSGDAGLNLFGNRLGFDQSGTRSWTMKAASGFLNVYAGDNAGSFNLGGRTNLRINQGAIGYPNTGPINSGTTGWRRLGRWQTGQGGRQLVLQIAGGVGYNAGTSQQGEITIILRTSNGSSSQTATSGPDAIYLSGYFYQTGYSALTSSNIRVVQVNTSTYDVYIYTNQYYGDSPIIAHTGTGSEFLVYTDTTGNTFSGVSYLDLNQQQKFLSAVTFDDLKVDNSLGFVAGSSIPAAAISYHTNGFIYVKGGGGGVAIGDDGFTTNIYCNDGGNVELNVPSGYAVRPRTNGAAGFGQIYSDGNGAIYSANGDVQFFTNNSAYAINWYKANKGSLNMRLLDSGSLLIGTGSQVSTHKLTVNGKIGGLTFSDSYLEFVSGNGYLKANDNVIIGYSNQFYVRQNGGVTINRSNTASTEKLDIGGNVKIFPASSSWAEGLSFSMPTQAVWGGIRWRRERSGNDGNHYIGYVGNYSNDDLVFGSNTGGTQVDYNLAISKDGRATFGGVTFDPNGQVTMNSTRQYGLVVNHNQVNYGDDFDDALFIKNINNDNNNLAAIGMSTNGSDGQHHRATLIAKRDTSANYRGNFLIKLRQSDGSHPYKLFLQYNGDLHADGDVVAYSTTISDKRLKDKVVTIDSALDKVKSLRGVEYVWNNGSKKGKKDLGVIAQEVEEILPEIVTEKKMELMDGKVYKTVDYEKLTAVLIESVKELSAKVEALENKCNCNCK